MQRNVIGLLLCAMISNAAGPPPAQVAKLSSGTVVIVRLASGEEIRGRFESVTPDSLELMTATADTIGTRAIPLQDIKSIRQHSRTGRNMLAAFGGLFMVWFVVGGVLMLSNR